MKEQNINSIFNKWSYIIHVYVFNHWHIATHIFSCLAVKLCNRVAAKRDGMSFCEFRGHFARFSLTVRNLESQRHKNGHTLLTTLGARVLKRL